MFKLLCTVLHRTCLKHKHTHTHKQKHKHVLLLARLHRLKDGDTMQYQARLCVRFQTLEDKAKEVSIRFFKRVTDKILFNIQGTVRIGAALVFPLAI